MIKRYLKFRRESVALILKCCTEANDPSIGLKEQGKISEVMNEHTDKTILGFGEMLQIVKCEGGANFIL